MNYLDSLSPDQLTALDRFTARLAVEKDLPQDEVGPAFVVSMLIEFGYISGTNDHEEVTSGPLDGVNVKTTDRKPIREKALFDLREIDELARILGFATPDNTEAA